MKRFQTLLLREWLQNRRGWLLITGVPLLLALLLVVFGGHVEVEPRVPYAIALVAMVGLPVLLLGLAMFALLAQAASLGRRDTQDRSIEFWLSLPTGHSASIAAPVLMHLLAFPFLALAIGFVGGQLLSHLLVWRVLGVDGWQAVPWQSMLLPSVLLLARVAVGLLLAAFWLAPVMLVGMAGSAWLKRWGVPVVVGGLFIAHQVLERLYGISVIGNTVGGLFNAALRSLIYAPPVSVDETLRAGRWPLPADWALRDLGGALSQFGQPLTVAALLISALAFGLLVLRRRQGG